MSSKCAYCNCELSDNDRVYVLDDERICRDCLFEELDDNVRLHPIDVMNKCNFDLDDFIDHFADYLVDNGFEDLKIM